MNKTQEKLSPVEKKKLKKRLQTLFKNQTKDKVIKKRNTGENRRVQTEEYENRESREMRSVQFMKDSKSQKSLPHAKNEKKISSRQQLDMDNPVNIKGKDSKKSSPKNKTPQQKTYANSSSSSQQEQKPFKVSKSSKSNKTQSNDALKTSSPTKLRTFSSSNKNTTQKAKPNKKEKTVTPLPKTQTEETLKQQNKSEFPIGTSSSSKVDKNRKKNKSKNKKRKAAETLKEQPVSNKKSKLNDKKSKAVSKKKKFLNSDSLSDEKNEFDLGNMNGFVRGGDFDFYSDSNSDSLYHGKELEHVLPNSDSDSEDDYHPYYGDYSNYFYDGGESEEEEEHYSDFDEDDYDEDEDPYDYGVDSDGDEYSYRFDYNDNDMSYDYTDDEHDYDYELPKHVPEDLIVHKGTANKRDLKPEDNVKFNNDAEKAQIVELQEQEIVKVIKQPKAYDKEELIKLKYNEKILKALTFQTKQSSSTVSPKKAEDSNDAADCPKLVPIVDEDGFQLYNLDENEEIDVEYEDYDDEMDDVSLGSEYTELNSDEADSLLSDDINDKYLKRGYYDSDDDNEIDVSVWTRKHKVNIIDATNCKYVDKKPKKTAEDSEESSSDSINQLLSVKLFENVDLNTASNILSATVIDEKKEEQEIELSERKLSPKRIEKSTEREAKVQDVTETTDIEDKMLQNQATQRVKSSTAQSLLNYNTKFFNALDSNLVLVLLKDPFYIYGTVRLTLLAGNVEVYGHCLSRDQEVELFSPRGCSVIEITPASKTKSRSEFNLKAKLKNYENSFAIADLETICGSYDSEHDAVVLLRRNDTRKKVVQQFKKFMNENVFPNLNNINVDRPLYNTEYLLRCMINTTSQEEKCLRIPHQWQQLNITAQSRVMVTGGKGVGKSTLLRYLINRHLPQEILLIDLDIGQPEVFIPQTVSCTVVRQPLLGPGFMLNLQPDISYAVGHTNIALCAHTYIEAVHSLIRYCIGQEKYRELPWLINTMGYNKGFGFELISVITKELENNLTDVIQLQSAREINNFDSILFSHVLRSVPRNMFVTEEQNENTTNTAEFKDYHLHVWQSAVQQESRYQKEWEMSAKDLRFAMLLTRLSQALQGHAEWLTDCKPLSASLDELKIFNLMDNTPLATAEELAKATEANLVYLCHYEENNKSLKCLGLGVIRAIDFHVRQVYLLPAIPLSLLKDVNCLALGEMPLPTSIFTNQGPRVKNTAPFVYNTIAANASKAIKQIYHRPRRFLTGKHKSLD